MSLDMTEFKKVVNTHLSLQCNDKKDAFIQIRTEEYFKTLWKLFCKKYGYNSSALIRERMLKFMIKKGALKVIDKPLLDFENIDIEDMPAECPTKKELEINI